MKTVSKVHYFMFLAFVGVMDFIVLCAIYWGTEVENYGLAAIASVGFAGFNSMASDYARSVSINTEENSNEG